MADKKVSELSAITNLSGDDLLLVVNDPNGTPTSNKVTVTNLFANVVPNVVHKGTVTARANTSYIGTTMTVSANATFSGTVTIGGSSITDQVNDRMQVANVQSILANTNSAISDRLQVANATAQFANSFNTILDGVSQANNFIAQVVRVTDSFGIGLQITNQASTPSTSNAITESVSAGTIFYDDTYLYIAVDENTIKRITLEAF